MALMGRPRKLTPLEEICVFNDWKDKKPYSEIAYMHKISTSTVTRIIQKFNNHIGGIENDRQNSCI